VTKFNDRVKKVSKETKVNKSGIHLVTLPIGNNRDLTFRAKEDLIASTIIYAEDTRVFREFCKHNDIDLEGKRIHSFHDHTGDMKMSSIVSFMKTNCVTVVSDAGSPIISDPSFPLVLAAKENNFPISSAPGVSAVVAALELSALPPSPFHFHSFIPRDKGPKISFFEECMNQYGTHIFFEGVSRVEKTLTELTSSYPNESFCIARELTKTHESVHRFIGSEWNEVKADVTFKGEFVILFTSSNKNQGGSKKIREMALEIIENGAHPKKISKLLAEITDTNAKDIYQAIGKK